MFGLTDVSTRCPSWGVNSIGCTSNYWLAKDGHIIRGCPKRSGKSVATPARLWYQSGVLVRQEFWGPRPLLAQTWLVDLQPDEPGEVEIPAYTALQADQRLADRMLELVLRGVSTRKYETVLPALADQVGVSKSEVSRETIEAGTRVLKKLAERDLSELEVLVVYLDRIVFGDYHVLAAVGVDADGRKHVLGVLRRGIREHGGHRRPARRPGGAGPAGGPPASVRHRWRQGATAGHRTGVRVVEPGATL